MKINDFKSFILNQSFLAATRMMQLEHVSYTFWVKGFWGKKQMIVCNKIGFLIENLDVSNMYYLWSSKLYSFDVKVYYN